MKNVKKIEFSSDKNLTIEERFYNIAYKGNGADFIALVKNNNVIEFWSDGFDGYEHFFSIKATSFKKVEKKMLADKRRISVECNKINFINPAKHHPRKEALIVDLKQFCRTPGKWYDKTEKK